MFTIERQKEIISLLKNKKSVTVAELSEKFFIGEATIRRDLDKLEKKGLLKKTYGGAVLIEGLDIEIPLSVRETEQKSEKEVIGQLASRLIHDNEAVIIDSSSTTLRIVPHLKNINNLTVITNGAKTAVELGDLRSVKVYCTGGMLRENSLSYIGEISKKCVENFFADTLFFSCRGISMEKGLTDSNESEAELRKVMIKNCRSAALLCDHSKLGKISFCRISDFDEIDYIITDKKPSPEWVNFFNEKGVELIHP